jgi:hypothetical protein
MQNFTYPAKSEITEDTTALPSHYAPVLDLGEPRVAMHLRELKLGLGADTLGQRGVADDVAECLPTERPGQQLQDCEALLCC